VVYHPLLDINFPGNVITVNKHLLEIATYDVFPTDDMFPPVFNLDTDSMEPLSESYNEANFETQNIILNLGSLLMVFLFIVLKFIIIGLTNIAQCKDKKYVKKLRAFTTGDLMWSGFLSFYFGSYSELCFSVLLHADDFSWGESSQAFPNILLFYFSVALVALPVWTIYFLYTRYENLEEDYY